MLAASIMLRCRDVLVSTILCDEMHTTHMQHATTTCDRHAATVSNMLCNTDLGSWLRPCMRSRNAEFEGAEVLRGNGSGHDGVTRGDDACCAMHSLALLAAARLARFALRDHRARVNAEKVHVREHF